MNKILILVGKDGRPSMKGTYKKMTSDSELWVRRQINNKEYWRVYTNHCIDDYEKVNKPNFEPGAKSIVIRWGNRIPIIGPDTIVYNNATAIAKATNKLLARKLFIEKGINCPKLVTPETVKPEQFPIIARPHYHAKGKNFVILRTMGEFINHGLKNSESYYYSEYINKVREYRLHVAHGRVLNYLEKPNPNNGNLAWNRAQNGEAFENVKWNDYNADVCKEAIKAIKALNLDFGGVDVMVDKEGKVYVLEVNTAATLASSEYSMTRYAMYFDWLAKSKERRDHWEFKEFKKASNYAWHTYHFEDRLPDNN